MNLKVIATVNMVILLTALAACSSSGSGNTGSQSPCDQQSTVKGTIGTINQGSGGALSLLIDGTKEQNAAYDMVYATVNSNTPIYEKQGSACNTVSSSTLKVGQRVQVQPTGPVAQSYPPQLVASNIVILPAS